MLYFFKNLKGVMPVLSDYKTEVEQIQKTALEGWDRL